jgi:hypothetical protein
MLHLATQIGIECGEVQVALPSHHPIEFLRLQNFIF